MKKTFLIVGVVLSIFIASCSGTAATAPTGDTYVSPNLPTDYEGALAIRNQLALGTIELNQTDSPIPAEQAQQLVLLWQALRSTQQAGGRAQAEVNAMLRQIESAMTAEQLHFIASLQLTQTDMQTWATANGISMENGGTPGQGMGMSPDARATKQAEAGVTSTSNGSGSKLNAALLDAVIFSLVAQLP